MDTFEKNNFKLSDIKKENPFKVPDEYFDGFSARLHKKLEAEKVTLPQAGNRIIRFLKPVLAVAASIAVIFLLVNWPLKTFLPFQTAETNNNIEIIDNDYLSLLESMDEEAIFALLENESLEEDFSDEDLMQYVTMNVSNYELYAGTVN